MVHLRGVRDPEERLRLSRDLFEYFVHCEEEYDRGAAALDSALGLCQALLYRSYL